MKRFTNSFTGLNLSTNNAGITKQTGNMSRIKYKITIALVFIIFSNVACFAQKSKFDSLNETYAILQAYSSRIEYRLNRKIVMDEYVRETVLKRINMKTFSNQLYNAFDPVDINGLLTEHDLIDIREKINSLQSPPKWNRKSLKKLKISIIKKKIFSRSNQPYYKTSLPIFFKYNQFAIIYVYSSDEFGEYCDAIEMFKKSDDNDSWEYFGGILIGMS